MNTIEIDKVNRSINKAQTFKKLKIQFYILFLFSTILFASCKSGSENLQYDSQVGSESIPILEHHKDTIAFKVKSLIGFAANDFY